MLSPRLTNCPECANIPSLLKKIDCKLAELGNSLYNNISYMLNQPIPAGDILQLIAYKRILTYKYCNPNYAYYYSVAMIASRVIRITAGCVSRCNTPEPCIEVPCNITIVQNPTTTTTSTTIAPPTTTTTTTAIKYNYTVAGCERQDYFVIAYDGPGILPTGTIVSNGTPECFYILDQTLAIPDVGTIANVYGMVNCSVCINEHTTTTTSSSSTSSSTTSTSSSTTTTSSSSTSTTTSSSSTTTTTTTSLPNCVTECLPYFSNGSSVFIYKNSTIVNLTPYITGPIPITGDIANTANKLWLYTQTDIYEYDIISTCPFAAQYNKTIHLDSGTFGSGLTAVDDTTLYCSIGGSICRIDISGTSVVIIQSFSMPPNRDISGDMIYTTSNQLVCSYVDNITSNTYITIYNLSTGLILTDINISSITNPWGLYIDSGVLHICDNSGQIYSLNLITEVLTLVGAVGQSLNGASQNPECAILDFTPTTTTTTTV